MAMRLSQEINAAASPSSKRRRRSTYAETGASAGSAARSPARAPTPSPASTSASSDRLLATSGDVVEDSQDGFAAVGAELSQPPAQEPVQEPPQDPAKDQQKMKEPDEGAGTTVVSGHK